MLLAFPAKLNLTLAPSLTGSTAREPVFTHARPSLREATKLTLKYNHSYRPRPPKVPGSLLLKTTVTSQLLCPHPKLIKW